jgi:hypothetical protein
MQLLVSNKLKEQLMKSYLIGYDLRRPGQDYKDLIEAIKNLGAWWHCLDSTWIIKSNLTAEQIRDNLTPYIDDNDKLLVVKLFREAAWTGFDKNCADWLQTNL